jgi:hypothetical protein
VLTHPTLSQAALLARVNESYASWANTRLAERAAIESGLIPLVPGAGGRKAVDLPTLRTIPDDCALIEWIRSIGVERLLDLASAAEAAE